MGAAAFAHGRLGAPDLKVGILSDIHLSQAERYSSQAAIDAFNEAHADAAIVAGMVHTGDWTIAQIKDELSAAGIPVRRTW